VKNAYIRSVLLVPGCIGFYCEYHYLVSYMHVVEDRRKLINR